MQTITFELLVGFSKYKWHTYFILETTLASSFKVKLKGSPHLLVGGIAFQKMSDRRKEGIKIYISSYLTESV